jgi:hypothetical protein
MIEVTNGPMNWGKFLIGAFTAEDHQRTSAVDPCRRLLGAIGHGENSYLVVDLQTCEGAIFRLGGMARADLAKHRIWVCPLFEPFLEWLYAFTTARRDWWDDLPAHIDLPDAPFAMHGYRRTGEAKA